MKQEELCRKLTEMIAETAFLETGSTDHRGK